MVHVEKAGETKFSRSYLEMGQMVFSIAVAFCREYTYARKEGRKEGAVAERKHEAGGWPRRVTLEMTTG